MKITKRQLTKLVESIVKEQMEEEPAVFPKLVGVLKKIWAPVWNLGDNDPEYDNAYTTAESQTEKIITKAGMKPLEIKPRFDDFSNSLETVIVRVLYKSPTGESKRGAVLIDETDVTWSSNRLFTHKGWED